MTLLLLGEVGRRLEKGELQFMAEVFCQHGTVSPLPCLLSFLQWQLSLEDSNCMEQQNTQMNMSLYFKPLVLRVLVSFMY